MSNRPDHRLCIIAVAALLVAASSTAAQTRLTGRIVGADTGEPVAARLYIRGDDGKRHLAKSAAADGSAVHYTVQPFQTSVEIHTTLSAHPFIADLPAGDYTLTAERGKECLPLDKRITVGDKPVEVELKLQRWIDMAKRGWYSGDTHVHRTVADLRNVILAEDLNVALPLSYWVTRSHIPPVQGDKTINPGGDRDGKRSALIAVDDTHVIYPINTEYEIFSVGNKRHTLGAVFVLNHREALKMGAPPVGPIAAEARRQGALLEFDKHSWPWSIMIVPVMNVDLFELSNNHVWRTRFGFTKWTIEYLPEGWGVETGDDGGYTERGWIDFGFKTYYALLNCGFRMRPTGGTANGVHPVPLGFGRVYVELPDGFDYAAWMRGLNAGRSFVTTGPMLTVRFNEQPPGHTFRLPRDEAAKRRGLWPLRVTGAAHSAEPLDRIEIIVNGRVASTLRPANKKTDAGGYESAIDATVMIAGSSWAAVRCFEKRADDRPRFAHTAPVHVEIPGAPLTPRRIETAYFVKRIKDEITRNREVLTADEMKEYERALDVYEKLHEHAE